MKKNKIRRHLKVGIDAVVGLTRKKIGKKRAFRASYCTISCKVDSVSDLRFLVTFVTNDKKIVVNELKNRYISSVTNFRKSVNLLQIVTLCHNLLQRFVTLPIHLGKYCLLCIYNPVCSVVTNVTWCQVPTKKCKVKC